VHLGFHRPVGRHELDAWVAEQRVDEMLSALHVLAVQAGSALLVPAGVPHAVGPGILIIELQEPSDFTIAIERRSPIGGDLGLGTDLALSCVDREAWSGDRVEQLRGRGLGAAGPLLPPAAGRRPRPAPSSGPSECSPVRAGISARATRCSWWWLAQAILRGASPLGGSRSSEAPLC
jgi:hypothetical protein